MKGRNISPMVKPSSFPNFSESKLVIQIAITMFTKGIINSINHQVGFFTISNKTIILYIGTSEAHPSFPAFLR